VNPLSFCQPTGAHRRRLQSTVWRQARRQDTCARWPVGRVVGQDVVVVLMHVAEGQTVEVPAEQEGPGVVGNPRIGLTELDGSVKRGLEEASLAFTHEVHLPLCSCGSSLPLVYTTERVCARRETIGLVNNLGSTWTGPSSYGRRPPYWEAVR